MAEWSGWLTALVAALALSMNVVALLFLRTSHCNCDRDDTLPQPQHQRADWVPQHLQQLTLLAQHQAWPPPPPPQQQQQQRGDRPLLLQHQQHLHEQQQQHHGVGQRHVQKQQQQQPLPPQWRSHHLFSRSYLDPCPDQLVTGAWLDPTTGPKRQGGGVLPFTKEVQNIIWRHQHPADCTKARFLLYDPPVNGVGSILHVQSVALQTALDSGRVLIERPGTYLTRDRYCGDNQTMDSCYFLPITNCTLKPEEMGGSGQYYNNTFPESVSVLKDGNSPRVMAYTAALDGTRYKIPELFQSLLGSTAILAPAQYYWWRAMGVTFLARPNNATLHQLQERYRTKFRGKPLSPGCISLYIRHGDKHVESPVYTDEQYEAAVGRLRALQPSLTNQLFVSTEDPATIKYFTSSSMWDTAFIDMPRKPDKGRGNVQYMLENGVASEMLDALLNLDLSLQCDGFVASIESNWARLIDELRSTVRCKADALYMDAYYKDPTTLQRNFKW